MRGGCKRRPPAPKAPPASPFGAQLSQYALVVKDLKAASDYWEKLGIPAMDVTHPTLTDLEYHGQPGQFDQKLGWHRHGTITWEWITPLAQVMERQPGDRRLGQRYERQLALRRTGLAEHFPVAAEQPDLGELKKRLLTIQALETARCFEEGVLTHAEDADIGSIFGWGFPPYTGGTLSYVDTLGIREFVAECDRMAKSYGDRFKVSDWLRERAADGQSFHG